MQKPIIKREHIHGDMSLCNLASVNLVHYRKADEAGKKKIARCVVRALDNAISNGMCPVAEGNVTNDQWRYIGIGILNAANALALEGIVIDSPQAAEWFDEVMDDLSYNLYEASMNLAKKLGAFPGFKETKWAEGLTPVHMSLKTHPKIWQETEYGRNFVSSGKLDRWDELAKQIQEHGIRHAQVMAIAPTANSGKAINATESTEPVIDLLYKEEGTFNVTSLAPNIRQNMAFYKPAFECDQKALVLNACIRQKYIDQAGSTTVYFKKADSLKEMTNLHTYGFEMGLKTFYYFKQQKQIETDECVACAV